MLVIFSTVAVAQLPRPNLPDMSQVDKDRPLVRIELVSQYGKVVPGQRFAVAVILDIAKGWHLYANPNPSEIGKPTVIAPTTTAQLQFGKVIYPPGKELRDELIDEVSYVYLGSVVCYIPIEVLEAGDGSIQVQLLLTGLLCGDSGICSPWQENMTLPIEIANDGNIVAGTYPPSLFEGVSLAAAFSGDTTSQGDTSTQKTDGAEPPEHNWVTAILLAVAAGLLMNLMPCVWPIIPIAVMTLMQHSSSNISSVSQVNRVKTLKLGLTFAAGILAVFAGLAIVMSVFKLMYGQQFQSNIFKLVLLMIVFVLGLSMFGMFEIALPKKLASINVVKKGYVGTFAMGALATVLATPCGAPLLGGVLTYSLSKPIAITMVMFLIIGLGMASPYVVLTAFPSLLSRIPQSGNWMIRLKQALAFIMMAFAVGIVAMFPGHYRLPLLMFCVLIAFCVWLGMSVVNINTPQRKRMITRAIALLLVIIGSYALGHTITHSKPITPDSDTHWQQQLELYQSQHRIVVVKYTANWCKNCKVLDKIIYKTDAFKAKLAETDAVLVIADWSFGDQSINEALNAFGTKSIPFAAVYPARATGKPILLHDFYTLDNMLKAIDRAAGNHKKDIDHKF